MSLWPSSSSMFQSEKWLPWPPCSLLLKNKDEWEVGEQAEAERVTPGGLRLTQAESVPVPAAHCPSPPSSWKGRASSAQSSGKLQLALTALCLSTSLCFCLSHSLSLISVCFSLHLSLSTFSCLSTVSISLCESLFLCLSLCVSCPFYSPHTTVETLAFTCVQIHHY